MAEDIKIHISANADGAVSGVNKTAAAVEGLKGAIQGISRVMGIIGLIASVVAVFRRFSDASKKAKEDLVNLGKAMTQAADEAAKLDTTVAGMEAIGRAAASAGVSADALNDILDKYKGHEITFSELATAIGSTSEAIDKLEGRTSPGRAGRDYLTGLASDAAQRKEQETEKETEKKGLRAATEVIRKTGGGDNSPEANAAWNTLMKAARGDPARAAELYDKNKSWKNLTQVGVMGFATSMGQMPAAAQRYQESERQDAADRAAKRAEHDAEVARRRQAKADQEALQWRQAADRKRAAADLYTEAAASPEAAEAARARTESALSAARAALAAAEAAPAAAPAALATESPAAPDAAELRQQIDTLLQDLEIVTRASSDASKAAQQAEERRVAAHTAEVNRQERADEALKNKRADAAADAASVKAATREKIDAITVEAPRAATAEGSIGGIMGNQLIDASRLREQREAARDAIMKEQTILLAQIREALDE